VAKYGLLIYFDRAQAGSAPAGSPNVHVWQGDGNDGEACVAKLRKLLPVIVEGEVVPLMPGADGRYLLGLFNSLGVQKLSGRETADPGASRTAGIRATTDQVEFILGREFVKRLAPDAIEMDLPAGEIALLSFPER